MTKRELLLSAVGDQVNATLCFRLRARNDDVVSSGSLPFQ